MKNVLMNSKIVNIILILIFFNSCKSQSEIREKDIKINVPSVVIMDSIKSGQNTLIENSSKTTTYIIDLYSFNPKTTVYENKKEIFPTRQTLYGYYDRDDDECKKTIITIKPKEKISVRLFLFPINYYSFSVDKFYEVRSISSFSELSISGCENFISELKLKGYKIPKIDMDITSKLIFNHTEN